MTRLAAARREKTSPDLNELPLLLVRPDQHVLDLVSRGAFLLIRRPNEPVKPLKTNTEEPEEGNTLWGSEGWKSPLSAEPFSGTPESQRCRETVGLPTEPSTEVLGTARWAAGPVMTEHCGGDRHCWRVLEKIRAAGSVQRALTPLRLSTPEVSSETLSNFSTSASKGLFYFSRGLYGLILPCQLVWQLSILSAGLLTIFVIIFQPPQSSHPTGSRFDENSQYWIIDMLDCLSSIWWSTLKQCIKV